MSRLTHLERRLADLVARGVPTYTRTPGTFGTVLDTYLVRTSASGHEYEIDVTVCGTALGFVQGRYHGDPDRCYPDEGGYAEDVTAFFCRNGAWTELDLTKDEEANFNASIMEEDSDCEPDDGPDDDDFDDRCDDHRDYDF